MAEETTRNDQGQFAARLEQADMPTYKKMRTAQLAGDDEEDIDTEPAKQPTGEESMSEYKKLRKEQEQQKTGGGLQKKIDRMHRDKMEAKREAQELRERIARYESGEVKPGEAPPQPEVSDEDRRAWQARETRHDAAVEKARTEDPDFEDVQKAAGKIPITKGMRFHMLKMDNTWEIVKYLAKHPEIAKEWIYLPFGEANEKITKLSGKLEAAAERKDLADQIAKKIPSAAPSPIKPLGGGSTRNHTPLDEMDMQAYKKARAAGRVR